MPEGRGQMTGIGPALACLPDGMPERARRSFASALCHLPSAICHLSSVSKEVVPVRIGFDMLAVQSPNHGHRGIGRYSRHLVSALLARDDGHEYVLYAHAALPAERIPSAPQARIRRLGGDRLTASQRVDRLARANP